MSVIINPNAARALAARQYDIAIERQQTNPENPIDGFADALVEHVDEVNETMAAADDKAEAFLRGEDTSVHEVMIAMGKADVSFKLMSQITRKVVEAYQEIQRMQV